MNLLLALQNPNDTEITTTAVVVFIAVLFGVLGFCIYWFRYRNK